MVKRKVDFENRGFQDRWEAQDMFVDINWNWNWNDTKAIESRRDRNKSGGTATAKSQREAAVKNSYIVAIAVVKSTRPFTEWEFIKNCKFAMPCAQKNGKHF